MWLILPIVIVVAGIIFFWRQNQSPSVGTIKAKTSVGAARTDSEPINPKTLDGKVFKFEYLGSYQLRPALKIDSKSSEQYFLTIINPYSKHLAVSVEKLETGELAEHSSYKMRQVYPDKYLTSGLPVAKLQGKLVKNRATAEVVAFVTKGESVIVIALTSSSGSDDLAAEMSQLLTSFSWK